MMLGSGFLLSRHVQGVTNFGLLSPAALTLTFPDMSALDDGLRSRLGWSIGGQSPRVGARGAGGTRDAVEIQRPRLHDKVPSPLPLGPRHLLLRLSGHAPAGPAAVPRAGARDRFC